MSAERSVRTRYPLPRGLHAAIQTAFLVMMTLLVLVPLLAIFVGTFQDGNEIIRKGLSLDIDLDSLSLDNYVMLFTDSGLYFRWFANSVFLTAVQVIGTLLVSSFVAYGFAMYDFKGKNALFISVLVLMTVPFEIMMLPLYVMVNDIGLADSYSVLPRHEIARVSELLQSQLLQPLNITPIQPRLAEANLFQLTSGGPAGLSFLRRRAIAGRSRAGAPSGQHDGSLHLGKHRGRAGVLLRRRDGSRRCRQPAGGVDPDASANTLYLPCDPPYDWGSEVWYLREVLRPGSGLSQAAEGGAFRWRAGPPCAERDAKLLPQ